MTTLNAPQTSAALDRLARKRASAKLGWYIHALVYVCVNVMLFSLLLVSPSQPIAVLAPSLKIWPLSATFKLGTIKALEVL